MVHILRANAEETNLSIIAFSFAGHLQNFILLHLLNL